MPRAKSITSLRKQYIQLKLFSDEELETMKDSGRAKRDPEFVLALDKEKVQREKERAQEPK